MFSTGDKPGQGSYMCEKCRIAVVLEDDSKVLPYCPCCEAKDSFTKSWDNKER